MVGNGQTTTLRIRKRVQAQSRRIREADSKHWQRRKLLGKQRQLAGSVVFLEECKDASLFWVDYL